MCLKVFQQLKWGGRCWVECIIIFKTKEIDSFISFYFQQKKNQKQQQKPKNNQQKQTNNYNTEKKNEITRLLTSTWYYLI